ncbi:MAG: 3-hydroxyacyl-ACP dehydratase FabZ [Candidatus Manganitrophaceae bacterium]
MERKEALIDIEEITRILPHRYPFLLVDRILEIDPGKRIVGFKNVTINEPFFQGHFPKHPIMPGVLIIEAMAQVGGILAFKSTQGSEGQLVFFLGIDKAKFRKPVYPGDQLRIEVEVVQERPPFWRLQGMSYVDGKLVAEAELKAMLGQEEKGGIGKGGIEK